MNENIKYCTKCGSILLEEDKFCASCGSEVRQRPSAHKHPDPAEAVKPEQPTAKAPVISIHNAAEDGNIEAVKQHLAAGTAVNTKNEFGAAPLHYAAYKGHKKVVVLLIAKGAGVNAKSDSDGGTPLHEAAYNGQKEIVKLLIAKKADVNAQGEDEATPLHFAALGGHKEVAEILIANGAAVNANRNDGATPLAIAIDLKHTKFADLLRKHGGNARLTGLTWDTVERIVNPLRKHGRKGGIQSSLSSVSRASSSTELPTNKELFSTIKTCKACGNPVSTDAEKCPRCGKQWPTTASTVRGVIKGIVCFVVIYLIIQVAPRLWDDYRNWKHEEESRPKIFWFIPLF